MIHFDNYSKIYNYQRNNMQIRLWACAFVLNLLSHCRKSVLDRLRYFAGHSFSLCSIWNNLGPLEFRHASLIFILLSLENLHNLLKRAVLQQPQIDSDRVVQYWSIYKNSLVKVTPWFASNATRRLNSKPTVFRKYTRIRLSFEQSNFC